jgi:hypothetical protein
MCHVLKVEGLNSEYIRLESRALEETEKATWE